MVPMLFYLTLTIIYYIYDICISKQLFNIYFFNIKFSIEYMYKLIEYKINEIQ